VCGGHQHEVAILDYDILILKLERQSTYSILDEDNANSELEILAMDWRFPVQSILCLFEAPVLPRGRNGLITVHLERTSC